MVDAKVGDHVLCKIKDASIVPASEPYDEKRVFEIVGVNYQGWHVYTPPYITIKGTIPVTERNHIKLGIDSKFVGWEVCFITSSMVCEITERMTGVVCNKCNEHFKDAVSNQDDGTFICWLCRNYKQYR